MTIYAKEVPTTDQTSLGHLRPQQLRNRRYYDVVFFASPTAQEICGRVPWHYSKTRPTRRNKKFTLNCVTYDLVWLN